MVFLKQLQLNRDGTCSDFDVREGQTNGRWIGRIYKDISAGDQWFWCLNDRAPSPAADRGDAPIRAKAKAPMVRVRAAEAGRDADGPTRVDQ
jgi:hypothetical protein